MRCNTSGEENSNSPQQPSTRLTRMVDFKIFYRMSSSTRTLTQQPGRCFSISLVNCPVLHQNISPRTRISVHKNPVNHHQPTHHESIRTKKPSLPPHLPHLPLTKSSSTYSNTTAQINPNQKTKQRTAQH